MNSISPAILDFANHHTDATLDDIKKLCESVLQYGFNSAFVNPLYVRVARGYIGTKAKVGTVISFPLGGDVLDIKIHAIREAVLCGADELDIVPTISLLKSGAFDDFQKELMTLTAEAKHMRSDIIVKFIIEMGFFVDEQGKETLANGIAFVKNAATMIESSGADFVKLCSGMGPRGVTPSDVAITRTAVKPETKVKAAGGINTREEALDLIAAGANRLGTSKAIEIILGKEAQNPQNQGE